MDRLTSGEREVLEHIVSRYKDYKDYDPTNQTVFNWVQNAREKLKEDDYARIISDRDC